MIRRANCSVIRALALALMFHGAAHAGGTTWWVTNDGIDSAGCGNRAKPCRSISQAIEHAAPGDAIEVGAGIYGDTTGDGTFSHPGDEHPQRVPGTGNAENQTIGCIVCIGKPLEILSLHGASATFIVAPPSTPYSATVAVTSPGVVFGASGAGFTLVGGNSYGVLINQNFGLSAAQRNVTIAGNIDVGDGTGFQFVGNYFTDRPCPDPSCLATATIFFTGNQAINNPGAGFAVEDNQFSGGLAIKGNLARGGGTGFLVATGLQSESGAAIGSGNIGLMGNVASANGYGFNAALPGDMLGNTAVANLNAGFLVIPSAMSRFQGNSAIGNGGPGLILQDSADVFDTGYGEVLNMFRSLSQNNFYGNDRHRPTLGIYAPNGGRPPGIDPGPSAHCGILNVGNAASAPGQPGSGDGPPLPILQQASGNFWGSAAGPSSTGPGDAVGGPCDQNGGVTVVKTFATMDFAITAMP